MQDDNELLLGVLNVLEQHEKMAQVQAGGVKVGDSERAFFCGGMAMCQDLQEYILTLVEMGQRQRRSRIRRWMGRHLSRIYRRDSPLREGEIRLVSVGCGDFGSHHVDVTYM